MSAVIDYNKILNEAREIAAELQLLLREDLTHRLGLNKYSIETDQHKWSPDLVRRALLAESLNKKLQALSEINH